MVLVIRNVEQTLLRGIRSSLEVTEVDTSDLLDASFLHIFNSYDDYYLGLACSQNAKGIVTHLAFATSSRNVLCVRLAERGSDPSTRAQAYENLQRIFLLNERRKYAFDMHKLALALFLDCGILVTQAVDLQSSRRAHRRQSAPATLMALLRDEASEVNKRAIFDAFQGEARVPAGDVDVDNLAVQAWAARQAALRLSSTRREGIPCIDTSAIPTEVSLTRCVIRTSDFKLCGTARHVASEVHEDFVAPPPIEAHVDEERRRRPVPVRE